MNKKISGLLVCILISGNVCAKSNATDANGDGMFSRDEMIAAAMVRYEKKFVKADLNNDGRLTIDELTGKRLVAKAADLNKDGVITRDELKLYVVKMVDKRLAKKDLNRDGVLSKDERTTRRK